MSNPSCIVGAHDAGVVCDWVKRWSHLLPAHANVLDIACGHGRHMKWFAQQGHHVTGIDRSAPALADARNFGETVLADIENGPWPLIENGQPRQFDAVVVTNYLWRALFPTIFQSLAPGGILIYETFALGNETIGKPARPDFLLRQTELLEAFKALHFIAFEQGFLQDPPRIVQRIAAVRLDSEAKSASMPGRYALDPLHSR